MSRQLATSAEVYDLLREVLGLPAHAVSCTIMLRVNEPAEVFLTTHANVARDGKPALHGAKYRLVKREEP